MNIKKEMSQVLCNASEQFMQNLYCPTKRGRIRKTELQLKTQRCWGV